jgi:hypothetical protein
MVYSRLSLQIVPIVAEEESRLVVVTVYTFFFQEGDRE